MIQNLPINALSSAPVTTIFIIPFLPAPDSEWQVYEAVVQGIIVCLFTAVGGVMLLVFCLIIVQECKVIVIVIIVIVIAIFIIIFFVIVIVMVLFLFMFMVKIMVMVMVMVMVTIISTF